jgi:hypothetical protein
MSSFTKELKFDYVIILQQSILFHTIETLFKEILQSLIDGKKSQKDNKFSLRNLFYNYESTQ